MARPWLLPRSSVAPPAGELHRLIALRVDLHVLVVPGLTAGVAYLTFQNADLYATAKSREDAELQAPVGIRPAGVSTLNTL